MAPRRPSLECAVYCALRLPHKFFLLTDQSIFRSCCVVSFEPCNYCALWGDTYVTIG